MSNIRRTSIRMLWRNVGAQWLILRTQDKSLQLFIMRESDWSSQSSSSKDRRCLLRKSDSTRLLFQFAQLIWIHRPISTFQSYFQRIVKSVRNPGTLFNQAQQSTPTTPTGILQQFRNINQQQLVAGGIIVAECLGFFTVGEMIGRFKLVGYRGDTGAHH